MCASVPASSSIFEDHGRWVLPAQELETLYLADALSAKCKNSKQETEKSITVVSRAFFTIYFMNSQQVARHLGCLLLSPVNTTMGTAFNGRRVAINTNNYVHSVG